MMSSDRRSTYAEIVELIGELPGNVLVDQEYGDESIYEVLRKTVEESHFYGQNMSVSEAEKDFIKRLQERMEAVEHILEVAELVEVAYKDEYVGETPLELG
jgi:hypothetical protein